MARNRLQVVGEVSDVELVDVADDAAGSFSGGYGGWEICGLMRLSVDGGICACVVPARGCGMCQMSLEEKAPVCDKANSR